MYTCILINTPGTPAAAATVLDGHPLMKLGRGGETMGMALWAPVIGGIISTLALIAVLFSLRKWQLSLGRQNSPPWCYSH